MRSTIRISPRRSRSSISTSSASASASRTRAACCRRASISASTKATSSIAKRPRGPKSEAELDDLWRKRIKNDWLRLKLAGKNDKDIRDTLDKRYANYLDRVHQLNSEDVFQTFMNAYAMSIEPHTNYLGPRASENFDIAMKLSLEGIGAVLQRDEDYTAIREIVPGGPAALSGKVKVGDRVVGVGQGDHGPIVDVVGWRLDDVVEKIRGAKDTVVRLEILPADAGPDGKHDDRGADAQEGQHRRAGRQEIGASRSRPAITRATSA